jgi:hypothetical protein
MTPIGGQLPLVLREPKPSTQNGRVLALMRDGQWRTLGEIKAGIGGISEAGVSARLRDLDNVFGIPHEKQIRAGCRNLYEYRIL